MIWCVDPESHDMQQGVYNLQEGRWVCEPQEGGIDLCNGGYIVQNDSEGKSYFYNTKGDLLLEAEGYFGWNPSSETMYYPDEVRSSNYEGVTILNGGSYKFDFHADDPKLVELAPQAS